MNKNRVFSQEVYGVQNKKTNKGDVLDKHYVVVDVVNTDKDTIGNEKVPKENGMQAMVVGEVQDEYKEYKSSKLKSVAGYPESVVKTELTIAYAGTKDWQDWKTNGREIARNDKHWDGAFHSALSYAEEIRSKYPEYKISTTGHSLGGAEAIYVAALLGVNAVTYGAAGSGLTEKQINAYEGTIINIYDTSDAITSGLLTGGKNKIPFYSELEKVIQQNPSIGVENDFSVYVVDTYNDDEENSKLVLLGINRLPVAIKDFTFSYTLGSNDNEYVWERQRVEMKEETAGILQPNSALPIVLPITEEQVELLRSLEEGNTVMAIDDFKFEEVK